MPLELAATTHCPLLQVLIDIKAWHTPMQNTEYYTIIYTVLHRYSIKAWEKDFRRRYSLWKILFSLNGLPVDPVSSGETLTIALYKVNVVWGSVEWSSISKQPVQWHLAGESSWGMLFMWRCNSCSRAPESQNQNQDWWQPWDHQPKTIKSRATLPPHASPARLASSFSHHSFLLGTPSGFPALGRNKDKEINCTWSPENHCGEACTSVVHKTKHSMCRCVSEHDFQMIYSKTLTFEVHSNNCVAKQVIKMFATLSLYQDLSIKYGMLFSNQWFLLNMLWMYCCWSCFFLINLELKHRRQDKWQWSGMYQYIITTE